MSDTILVTYATSTGSTREIAHIIADTLRTHDLSVVVKPVEEITALDDYRAVVLGSAVQYGKCLPTALTFANKHQTTLAQMPVAVFCVHIQNLGDDVKSVENRTAYLDDMRAVITPIAETYFAGRFSRDGARRLMPRILARFMPDVDLRDAEAFRTWAAKLAPRLQAALMTESDRA